MNNIIGPIDIDSWYFMRMLRESITYSRKVDPVKYRRLIQAHSELYRKELKQWL